MLDIPFRISLHYECQIENVDLNKITKYSKIEISNKYSDKTAVLCIASPKQCIPTQKDHLPSMNDHPLICFKLSFGGNRNIKSVEITIFGYFDIWIF